MQTGFSLGVRHKYLRGPKTHENFASWGGAPLHPLRGRTPWGGAPLERAHPLRGRAHPLRGRWKSQMGQMKNHDFGKQKFCKNFVFQFWGPCSHGPNAKKQNEDHRRRPQNTKALNQASVFIVFHEKTRFSKMEKISNFSNENRVTKMMMRKKLWKIRKVTFSF